MTRLFLIMPAFKFTVISLSRYGWMFTYLSLLLQEINNVVAARIVFCPLQVRKQASASANLLFVR